MVRAEASLKEDHSGIPASQHGGINLESIARRHSDLPCGDGGERPDGDVLRRVPEVAAHVDAGHDAGEGGEEDAEHAEPVVVLRVVRAHVRAPHRRVPPVEAVG